MTARAATKQADADPEGAYFRALVSDVEDPGCKHVARYVSEHYYTGARSWVCLNCGDLGVEEAA